MENNHSENSKNNNNMKYTYKDNLWMYFDSIKNKFFSDREKAKQLLYLISQKNDLIQEYSENLKYLYNQSTLEFNIDSKFPINSNDNTLNNAIYSFINSFKTESDLYEKNAKFILDTIIKPLEGFIINQCEINYELTDLMNTYQNEFKLIIQQLEEKQINFHQSGKSVEMAINKLESLNNEIKMKQENDPNFNIEESKEKEQITKYNAIKEKNILLAKTVQMDYENYVDTANEEREKYIQLCQHAYDKIQELDEEFIKTLKIHIKNLTENEINLQNNLIEEKQKIIKKCDLINVENDINLFINSKICKFEPPKPFEFIDYYPTIILRNRKSSNNLNHHNISQKIVKEINDIFIHKKNIEENDEIDSSEFVMNCVYSIWEDSPFNRQKLEELLNYEKYRLCFLRVLNQYRVEGIFVLKNNSFQNLSMTLNTLLIKAIENSDYECIKLCMILSQTFYLGEEKEVLLQSGISLNDIWQKKEFWEEIIEYSINSEVNSSKGYLIFLEEDSKSREKRVESAVLSNLITFQFNMKLFGYPEKSGKEIIDEFIKKYKIDGNMVYQYSADVSLKNINDEIINESVSSTIKTTEGNNVINVNNNEANEVNKKINNEEDKNKIEEKESNKNEIIENPSKKDENNQDNNDKSDADKNDIK